MKASKKKANVFLILAGVIWFFFLPNILFSAALGEMHANQPLAFETADLDDCDAVFEQHKNVIGSISVWERTLRTDCYFPFQSLNTILDFSSPTSSPLILRC